MGGKLPVSPLAPASCPQMPPIDGVRLGVAATGSRYRGRDDALLAQLDEGTAVAGVLTRSRTASAPVEWCRANLGRGRARAVLVNAGNANAFTGARGTRSTRELVRSVADVMGCRRHEVFIASTGVIGEPLDPAPITGLIGNMAAQAASDIWSDAARAIMTTDTFPKLATASARFGGAEITVNGIAKGSGMIAPDMATMLAFLFTDAALPAGVLQKILNDGIDRSFNAITVDGDTSTSDTVLFFATGAAANRMSTPVASASDRRLREFRRAVDTVLLDLAHQVVRDGEGARKFIRIDVAGAENARAARVIGLAIANSPLVKTAIAGEDANWGRIVMAVGKSGEAARRDKLAIWIGGVRVAMNGMIDTDYREASLTGHMRGDDIEIAVDVGVGRGRSTVWTCDLTHGYIDINADYRS